MFSRNIFNLLRHWQKKGNDFQLEAVFYVRCKGAHHCGKMTAICYSRGLGAGANATVVYCRSYWLVRQHSRSLGNYEANFIKLRLGKKNSNGPKNKRMQHSFVLIEERYF